MTETQRGQPPAGYQAYLVRLWQESPRGSWRALAKDARTGDEVRFATLEQLFLFLHGRTTGESVREGSEP
jgi:subtilisin-like proprotein convertase family protein